MFILLFIIVPDYASAVNRYIYNDINSVLNLKQNMYILESERTEGVYTTGELEKQGFVKYDGSYLPDDKNYPDKMYVIRSFFYLDEKLRDEELSLYIEPKEYPFKVYVNGKLLYKRGRYKNNKYNSTIFYTSSVYLPGADRGILNYGEKRNDIAIEVFPIYERHPFGTICLKSYSESARSTFIRNFFNVNIPQTSFVISMLLLVYFIFLYFSRNKKDPKFLYFSLVCLSFGLSINHIAFFYDSNTEILRRQLSISAFPFAACFLSFFIMEFTRILNKNKLLKILMFTPCVIITILLFLKASKLWTKQIYNIIMPTLTFPLIIFAFVIIIISVFKNKHHRSIPVLISMTFTFAVIIYDIAYSLSGLIPFVWLTSYGFIAIIISIFFTLAYENSKLYLSSLKREEELKRLNKLKDDFISNTSHELKTPLNGIIGIADSMIEGAVGELPEEAVVNLSMIVASGKRLFTLVNNILDFSKLKNEYIILKSQSVDLREIVNVVLLFSKHLVNKKDIKLINDINDDIPLLYADEDRLQQILYNLIGNSIKFTEKGYIKISAELEKNNKVKITVEDTGKGIDPSKHNDIFKSFQQEDSSISRTYGGTGLGLSIAKQLVELHHGDLWVESEAGKGAKFHFTINVYDNKKADLNKEQKRILLKKTDELYLNEYDNADLYNVPAENLNDEYMGNILAVDDDIINIQVLINYLTLYKYKVDHVENGVDALEMVKNNNYDLILLDLMMPNMSGYTVCNKIRADHPANELPIILLTAKSMPEDILVGFEAGANDYLVKPFSREELIARIQLHMRLSKINIKYKKAEEQIRELNDNLELKVKARTIQLQEAHDEMRSFSYAVSHDLRGPMGIIQNVKNLMFRDYYKSLDEKGKQYLDYIQKNINKMTQIIEGLLLLSRVTNNQLRKEEIDITSIVNELMHEVKYKSHIEKQYETIVQENMSATADKTIIRVALENLIGNAFKYSSKKENPKIECGIMEETNDEIIFYIKDNGAGFDMKYLDKLFVPFERLHLESDFKGTGIGLATVKKAIERHGGNIWAKSIVGEGTTFFFTLPKN